MSIAGKTAGCVRAPALVPMIAATTSVPAKKAPHLPITRTPLFRAARRWTISRLPSKRKLVVPGRIAWGDQERDDQIGRGNTAVLRDDARHLRLRTAARYRADVEVAHVGGRCPVGGRERQNRRQADREAADAGARGQVVRRGQRDLPGAEVGPDDIGDG